uniref:Minor capsid protein P8 central region domain-containing protein n=1 Tax=viral metagenome TaxID=1070528 RepID=A0A6C0C6Q8_9ZZZZ
MSNFDNNEPPINFNNGLMPKIYEHKDNLDHVMVNNDIKLTPGKTVHCADNILSGVLEETYLSKYFFSDDNIMNIQKLIRYEFFKEKDIKIDYQSNNILLTIMRGIFLKYSNSAARSLDEIKEQIIKLNDMVVQYSLGKIYSNYDMHNKYLKDINNMPNLMDLPKSNYRENYTHDLSERNNMTIGS